jgi:alpha/beta superfamily hydrolase
MVLQGQFLERSVVVQSGGLALDALYHRGDARPACVLAAPHPAMGGSMQSAVIAELAWALTQAGFPTLRFDYRGVGASQGQSRHAPDGPQLALADLADEAQDLLAAVDQLQATVGGPEPVCAIGYSFGAGVALCCAADERIGRLALVAPPTGLIDFASLSQVQKPALALLAEQDPLADRALVQRLLMPLGEQGALRIVPRADHLFRRSLTELGHELVRWLGGAPRGRRERPEPQLAGSGAADLELPEGDEPPLELDEA